MTLLELEKLLNDKVAAKFVGDKVKVDIGFHSDLAMRVKDVLNDIGLSDFLEYRPWKVKLKDDYMVHWDLSRVFDLTVDLKRDNRYKTQSVGVINTINFIYYFIKLIHNFFFS